MKSRSNTIATALAGVWRECLPQAELSLDDLVTLAPVLLRTEAGPLGWWRIRNSSLLSSPLACELQEAYRYNTLRSAVHERNICETFALFHSAGIEPVLVKGWAAARLYPEHGMRPYADIDLCVHPRQHDESQAVLRSHHRGLQVDLHNGLDNLDHLSFEDMFGRSQLVPLGDTQVRVPSPEDHLRILCLHMLRHGAWRPLWLCDIAIAVENRPSDFDWNRCLGSDRRRADWVACAIGLAHHLLGANIDHTPIVTKAAQLPRWLIRQVLKQWSVPVSAARGTNKHRAPMSTYLQNPGNLLKDLHTRWPDPIEATISVGGPLNNLPRLPYQLSNCLLRAGRFLKHLPHPLNEGPKEAGQTGLAVERVIEGID
jgi:hypothetical protein